MIAIFGSLVEIVVLFVAALAASWVLRHLIRVLTRRAMRRAQVRPGTWRARLRRRAETDADIETRTVDIHMLKLRKKITELIGAKPFIQTIRGQGYRLAKEA